MTTPLYSERLSFKILTKQDVSDQYIGWLNNPEINRYLETRFNQQNKENCEIFVTTILNDPASYLFGIFDKKTCSHIGNIKLGFINRHHNTAQLSLFIGEKECWGKGYATEAIKCITQWGFNILGLKISATFELIITIIAVGELTLFAALTLPHFQIQNLQTNPVKNTSHGLYTS